MRRTPVLGGLNEDFGTCPDPGDPLHAAICVAGAEGVTLVAAAGNDALAFDKTGKLDEESGDPRLATPLPPTPRCSR